MEKMKLTPAQIDAINEALSYYGDAEFLVDFHEWRMLRNIKRADWPALNDLSPTVLERALKYGYEVDKGPKKPHPFIMLHQKGKQQQSTIEALQAEQDYQLASLHDAMQQYDQAEIERCKQRLAEIHEELEGVK